MIYSFVHISLHLSSFASGPCKFIFRQMFKHGSLVSKYILLTKREVKMAGCWPSPLFAFLWTEMKSRSIKRQKENEANTQPS